MRSDFGMLLQEELAQIGERQAGVENVFDDEDILAFDRLVEILDDLDRAGGALALAVAGDGDKVEGGVGLDGAGQIDEKERRALEHADHDQLFAVQVAGDLRAHFGDALGDLLAGIKNVKALRSHGRHADSIARFSMRDHCVNQGQIKREWARREAGLISPHVYTEESNVSLSSILGPFNCPLSG